MMSAQVAAVSRNEAYSFSTPTRDSIRLPTGLGVEGDGHAGETIRHQFRMTYEPNLPNLRQVHVMHEELFDELALKGRAARYANEPGAHYVLVSTADTDGLGEFQFRSYRIVEGEVTEEKVTVVEAY